MNRVELMNDEPAPESRLLNILCYCTQCFIPERGEGYPTPLYEFFFFFLTHVMFIRSVSSPFSLVLKLMSSRCSISKDSKRMQVLIQLSLFWVRERSTSCSPLSSNFSENSPLCPAVYDNKRGIRTGEAPLVDVSKFSDTVTDWNFRHFT